MAICKAEALVIRKFDFRETSIIVEFFTREFGRLKGILKGIRSNPKKFGSTLEPFSCNEIVFYRSRNSEIHLVSQCDLRDNFLEIRSDLKKINLASFFMELTSALLAPEDKHEEVFELALSCLKDMSLAADPARIINIAQIKLLKLSGFKPHFDSCVLCDSKIDEYAKFSTAFGGLLCFKCAYRDSNRHAVLKGTVASIRHIEKSDWQNSQRLGLSPLVKEELDMMLNRFVLFHLEKKLKTARFI
ncbi:MAG TPA: DNA repair protein RecO [Candidatus Omnitrophica bacterium]|nr:DNA repair protein RecO [Candidatus Omnitrophota bacterium]